MNDAQRQKIKDRQRQFAASAITETADRATIEPPPPKRPIEEIAAEKRANLGAPAGIAVAFVRFVDRSMQIAGMQSGDSLTATVKANGQGHTIEFVEPWRAHVITFFDPTRHDVKINVVHESQIKTWEPA